MLKLHPKSFFVGQNQVYLPYCHSTNDVAAEIGKKGGFIDGTVVYTDHQTAGRGQRGTVWESESGKNLAISILTDTSFLELKDQFQLSMCAALAVFETIGFFRSDSIRIKWPNDIFIGNQKVAGILIENSLKESKIHYSVIGIGVNVNQTNFGSPRATSLKLKGIETDRVILAEKICENFENYFLKLKAGEKLDEPYKAKLLGLNEPRLFASKDHEFVGIIKGISPGGELLVESDFPQKRFNIKEISFTF